MLLEVFVRKNFKQTKNQYFKSKYEIKENELHYYENLFLDLTKVFEFNHNYLGHKCLINESNVVKISIFFKKDKKKLILDFI